MRYVHTGATPPTGRRRGIVYGKLQGNPIARAMAVPVQPQPNPQVQANSQLADLANTWRNMTALQQASWTSIATPTVSAYNQFIKTNQLVVQWGYFAIIEYPGPRHYGTIIEAFPYPEPDGIHTTLVILSNATLPSGFDAFCHLYVSWKPVTRTNAQKGTTKVYVGTYGPLAFGVNNYFDFTPVMNRFVGQWLPGTGTDTATHTVCGGYAYNGGLYLSDQFGNVSADGGPYPNNTIFESEAGTIGPGACPLPSSPPYPWPPSH